MRMIEFIHGKELPHKQDEHFTMDDYKHEKRLQKQSSRLYNHHTHAEKSIDKHNQIH
jgi:hypothetical protein